MLCMWCLWDIPSYNNSHYCLNDYFWCWVNSPIHHINVFAMDSKYHYIASHKQQLAAGHHDLRTGRCFPHCWPFVKGIHCNQWFPSQSTNDKELSCFPEQSIEQALSWPWTNEKKPPVSRWWSHWIALSLIFEIPPVKSFECAHQKKGSVNHSVMSFPIIDMTRVVASSLLSMWQGKCSLWCSGAHFTMFIMYRSSIY